MTKLKTIMVSVPTFELAQKLKAHLAVKTMRTKTMDDVVGAGLLLMAKKEGVQ